MLCIIPSVDRRVSRAGVARRTHEHRYRTQVGRRGPRTLVFAGNGERFACTRKAREGDFKKPEHAPAEGSRVCKVCDRATPPRATQTSHNHTLVIRLRRKKPLRLSHTHSLRRHHTKHNHTPYAHANSQTASQPSCPVPPPPIVSLSHAHWSALARPHGSAGNFVRERITMQQSKRRQRTLAASTSSAAQPHQSAARSFSGEVGRMLVME